MNREQPQSTPGKLKTRELKEQEHTTHQILTNLILELQSQMVS